MKDLPILTWDGRILSDIEVRARLSESSEGSEGLEVVFLEDLLLMGEEELRERELRNPNLPARERSLLGWVDES